jgi:drug/metabolite transporter (DMT)-like permease
MTQNDRSLDPPPLVKRPLEGLALAAALVTVVLWASAFVGIRAAAEDLSPGPLALGRLLAGSLGLGLVVLLRRPVPTPREPVRRSTNSTEGPPRLRAQGRGLGGWPRR